MKRFLPGLITLLVALTAVPAAHANLITDFNVGLNNFNPKYFLITGVPNPQTLTDPRVTVTARRGNKILVRLVNASYSILRTTISDLSARVIAADGHPLGGADRPWSSPFDIPANTLAISTPVITTRTTATSTYWRGVG